MISEDLQSLEVGEIIDLYTLDLSRLGGGQYHFTPSVDVGDGEVNYQGIAYTPIDLVINGFETTGRGVLPRPTLKVTNTHRVLVGMVQQFDDLVGATVIRIRTMGKYLDDGAEPDRTAHFPVDYWTISQKSAMTKLYIEFTLSAAIDVEGQKLPQRLILHNYCKRRYRRWDAEKQQFDYTDAQCPYTDSRYFDAQGNSFQGPNFNRLPTSPSQDRCGKDVKSCTLRFGSRLPGWFFPGAGRFERG